MIGAMRIRPFSGTQSIIKYLALLEEAVKAGFKVIKIIFISAFITFPSFSYCQLRVAAIPYSASAGLKPLSSSIKLASSKIEQKSFSERKNKDLLSGSKAFYFAERFNVAITPENAGKWENTASGLVWRLGIHSADAYSIYLTFQTFHLNKEVKLFVYTPGYKELKGAFTEKNNPSSKAFSIAPLSGEHLIIELNLPKGVTNYGSLRLSKVYHGVLNIFANANGSGTTTRATSCEQGINCENGTFWQTEKRAVCKIISDGALSTGTLVANTSKTAEAYLLTSQHTMFAEEKASEAIFVFNYEYQACQPDALKDDQTLSGATLLARSPGLDYALLRLIEQPPEQFNPYYAGWDVRNDTPAGGICIHHPGGKHKQIAIDYHPLSTASFNQSFNPNSLWKVNTWDIGSTEPGSSGSALFNPQHRVIGTLTGGYSSCQNSGSDFFSKLNLAWNAASEAGPPLKAWLDNATTNADFMDGYDPYGFDEENCGTSWNIADSEKTELSSSGQTWGYISGHNSSGYTRFAEKFSSPASLLIPAIYLNVAKVSASSPLAKITVKIWEGYSAPSREVYSQLVFLKDLKANALNHISLDSVVKVSGDFFVGYELDYNLPGSNFALYHAARREKIGASTLFVFNGSWHKANTFLNYPTSLAIGIKECYGKTLQPASSGLVLYPNPSKGVLNIELPTAAIIDDVTCYNLSGQQVPITFQRSELVNKVAFDLPAGFYILKIRSSKQVFTASFVIER